MERPFIPLGSDRIAIAHAAQVCERSVTRAYQGKVRTSYTLRRIADAARSLGLPLPNSAEIATHAQKEHAA